MVGQAAIPGRVLENPVIGDRVTFLKTTQETNGEYLLEQVELAPHGGNAMHYHVAFTEAFEVLKGNLHVIVDGQERVLGAGDTAFVPVNAPHRFYSTSDERVVFTIEFRPARQMEKAIRIAYGLARDGKTTKGRPQEYLATRSCIRAWGELPGRDAALSAASALWHVSEDCQMARYREVLGAAVLLKRLVVV